MSIYKRNKHHRKIYENYHGPIGKDAYGRSLEIHHINGDHSDNRIENLKLVSIDEHYQLHYSQGDWAACLLMADRMKISPEEQSSLAKQAVQKQIKEGKNVFVDGTLSKEVQRRRVEDGSHHMLGGKIQRNTQNRLLTEGKQNFKNPGFISSSKIRLSCVCCRKTVGLSGFSQHLKKHSP